MSSELKVYNRFGELTLHVRLSSGDVPELRTVDGTPEMRAAIASLKGIDFDRVVVKDKEHYRLTANWGSPGYLSVLARYFVTNFGWKTKIIETGEPSTRACLSASGNFPAFVYCKITSEFATGNTMMIVNVNEDSPDFQRTNTDMPTDAKATSTNVFATA
jgi:hypothetical protein